MDIELIIGVVIALLLIIIPIWLSIKSDREEAEINTPQTSELTESKATASSKDIQEEILEYLKESFWPEWQKKALLEKSDFSLLTEDPLMALRVVNEPYKFLTKKLDLNKDNWEVATPNKRRTGFNFDKGHLALFKKFDKNTVGPAFRYGPIWYDWSNFGVQVPQGSWYNFLGARFNTNEGYSIKKIMLSTNYNLNFDFRSAAGKQYNVKNIANSTYALPIPEHIAYSIDQITAALNKYSKAEWKKAILKLAKDAQKEANDVVIEFKSKFEESVLNSEGEVSLPPNIFNSLFDSNKDVINDKYRDNIADLMKVRSFINSKERILRDIIQAGLNSDDFKLITDYLDALIASIEFQETLLCSGVELLVSLFEDDIIKYHEIRDLFERLGVFNNTWQNNLIEKLSQMNGRLENIEGGLEQLNSTIVEFENRFITEVQQLQIISAEGFKAVTSGLNKVDSRMNVSNSIAAINAYQNYQTKKALKS